MSVGKYDEWFDKQVHAWEVLTVQSGKLTGKYSRECSISLEDVPFGLRTIIFSRGKKRLPPWITAKRSMGFSYLTVWDLAELKIDLSEDRVKEIEVCQCELLCKNIKRVK